MSGIDVFAFYIAYENRVPTDDLLVLVESKRRLTW